MFTAVARPSSWSVWTAVEDFNLWIIECRIKPSNTDKIQIGSHSSNGWVEAHILPMSHGLS